MIDVIKSIDNIYKTLGELNIKTTPRNVKVLNSIYVELEILAKKIVTDIKESEI